MIFTLFFVQARQILERHLIVADKAYTMDDFRKEANNNFNLSVKLPTVRDVSMYIKVKDSVEGNFIFDLLYVIQIKNNIRYLSIPNYLNLFIHFFIPIIKQITVILNFMFSH